MIELPTDNTVRLPFETRGVGNGYARPGPVRTYRLSPEELEALRQKFPPVDERQRRHWEYLKREAARARKLPEPARSNLLWRLGISGYIDD